MCSSIYMLRWNDESEITTLCEQLSEIDDEEYVEYNE